MESQGDAGGRTFRSALSGAKRSMPLRVRFFFRTSPSGDTLFGDGSDRRFHARPTGDQPLRSLDFSADQGNRSTKTIPTF